MRLLKQVVNEAAVEKTPEAQRSHPPNPELSEQLFSRVGYVEDFFETRTKLGVFSGDSEAAQNFRQQGRRECDDGGVPLRYVAGRHATENAAGGNFQQPTRVRGWRLVRP